MYYSYPVHPGLWFILSSCSATLLVFVMPHGLNVAATSHAGRVASQEVGMEENFSSKCFPSPFSCSQKITQSLGSRSNASDPVIP